MTFETSSREMSTFPSCTTAGNASHCLTPLIITSRVFSVTSSCHLPESRAMVRGSNRFVCATPVEEGSDAFAPPLGAVDAADGAEEIVAVVVGGVLVPLDPDPESTGAGLDWTGGGDVSAGATGRGGGVGNP